MRIPTVSVYVNKYIPEGVQQVSSITWVLNLNLFHFQIYSITFASLAPSGFWEEFQVQLLTHGTLGGKSQQLRLGEGTLVDLSLCYSLLRLREGTLVDLNLPYSRLGSDIVWFSQMDPICVSEE